MTAHTLFSLPGHNHTTTSFLHNLIFNYSIQHVEVKLAGSYFPHLEQHIIAQLSTLVVFSYQSLVFSLLFLTTEDCELTTKNKT